MYDSFYLIAKAYSRETLKVIKRCIMFPGGFIKYLEGFSDFIEAATNYYFNYRLICRLFSLFIH